MERCFFTDREFSVIHHALLNYYDDLNRILKHTCKSTFLFSEVNSETMVVKGLIEKFKL